MGVQCRHREGQGTVEIIPEPLQWNRKRVGMDGVRQGDLDFRQSEQVGSLIGHRDVEHVAARVALRFGSHREMSGVESERHRFAFLQQGKFARDVQCGKNRIQATGP